MSRKLNVFLSVFLSVMMVNVLCFSNVCYATESRDSSGGNCDAELTISQETANVDVYIKTLSETQGISAHIYLQKNTGNGWSTHATWIERVDGDEVAFYDTASVDSGATYRIRVFYYVYTASGTGQYVSYSDEVSY